MLLSNIQLSIIVCTYNREQYLPLTLDHLTKQTGNSSLWEVIIINNNSTDGTATIIGEFIPKFPNLNFKAFLETKQGHTHARNKGIMESKGRIISFLDDDAFVTPEYSKNIIEFFTKNLEAIALGGKIIPVYEGNSPKWMSKYLLPLVAALDMGDEVKKFKGDKFPIGANMAFRAEVFKKYGLFDPELGRRGSGLEGGDEKDVFARLKKNNEAIYYNPAVVVNHIIPDKRLTDKYIKGLAIGVGTSEKKRFSGKSFSDKSKRFIDEFIKIAATGVLSIYFLILIQPKKSLMLIKFRIWVIKGFMS